MKLKVAGVEYAIPQFTLGELRVMRRDFGLAGIADLDPGNPDHLTGLLYTSMRRVNPDITVDDIEALTEFELVEEASDPPAPLGDAAEGSE